MAPKRRPSAGRVVGVVRSTRKVVKETVQVTIFDGQEEDTAADINLVDTEELNDFVTPEVGQKVTVRTIPVEEARGASKKITRKKRRRVGGGEEGYRRYVYKVMKQVHPEMRISGIAMSIINSLMMDMFERIAAEAATLSRHSHRATISSKEIQGAVKLVLPGELGKHAIAEGSKAVSHYAAYEHNNK